MCGEKMKNDMLKLKMQLNSWVFNSFLKKIQKNSENLYCAPR